MRPLMTSLMCAVALAAGAGCSQQVRLSDEAVQSYKSFVNVVDETSGGNRLVVYSFGSPPLLLSKDVIKINGFALGIYRSDREGAIYSDGGGEAGPNIIVDYAAFDKGILRITDCVWDPRKPYEDDVPFVEKTVRISAGGTVHSSRRMVLEPEKGDEETIDRLFAQILRENKKGHADEKYHEEAADAIRRDLAQLRNIAIAAPGDILKRVKALPHLAGDCSCQPMKNDCICEVTTIMEIRAEEARR